MLRTGAADIIPVTMNTDAPTRGARVLWTIQTSVALFLVWMALDGVANLWLGAIFALLGGVIGAWVVPGEVYPWRPLRLLLFFVLFVRDSLLGGVDVAFRAMSPRLPIEPHFVEIKVWLPRGLPRTVMVATVSLLPGTLSVELDDESLHVHALTPKAAESLPRLQRRIGWLFSVEHREDTP